MKAQVNRKVLAEALGLAHGAVDVRNVRPLLQDICFRAKDGGLDVSATDLEVGIRISLKEGITVEKEGAIAIPAKVIVQIVQESADETLDMEIEGDFCRVRGADRQYKIAGEDAAEFPPIGPLPEDRGIEIEAEVLDEMIKKTRFSAATEMMRYALNGVLFVAKADDKNIEMVGADGRRLTQIRRKANSTASRDVSAILSLKCLMQMEKVLGGREGVVKLFFGERQACLATDNILLVAQLVEGHYPNYQDVIPDDCDKKAVIPRLDLESAVRGVGPLVSDMSRSVTFTFRANNLVVSSGAAELGEGRVEKQAQYDGQDLEIRFNPDFILDLLKVSEDDSVVIEFKEPSRPAIFKCGRNYQYLVMPITET